MFRELPTHTYSTFASSDEDNMYRIREPKSEGVTGGDDRRMTRKIHKSCAKDYVKVARDTFNSGKTRNLEFRRQQLRSLLRMYEETKEEMVNALYRDLHKPKQECYVTEIEILMNDVRNLLFNFNQYTKVTYPSKPVINIFDSVEIHKEPYGVVLVVGAWNYPLNLTMMPVAGAIAAGNTVIIKPSEMAAAVADYIGRFVPQYLDIDCVQVYQGGIPETTELLKERFDYIFFTGSPMVGKIVHQAAAKHLTPCTLELGGKSPVYIDDETNMMLTTRRILWGKLMNLGQTCIAPDYILCSKQTQENFLKVVPLILLDFFGEDIKKSNDLCRIINEQNFDRLANMIDKAKVAYGGEVDREQKYISPTILVNVRASDPVMQEEIFGPILPIVNVDTVDAAVKFINKREKPLAMYIFSTDKEHVNYILEHTSCGGVTINDTVMHITCETLPFGGVGNSGMGCFHGKLSFDVFTHEKSVLRRNFASFPEKFQSIRYPPYTDRHMRMSAWFTKKRKGLPTAGLRYVFVFLLGVLLAVIGACVYINSL